jgi:hypothetical protein
MYKYGARQLPLFLFRGLASNQKCPTLGRHEHPRERFKRDQIFIRCTATLPCGNLMNTETFYNQ